VSDVQNPAWCNVAYRQTVACGIPLTDALPEALRRLPARQIALVTIDSLCGPGQLAEKVTKVLGDRLHSTISGLRPHSPRGDVARVVQALQGIDGVVTLGGGSVCDTVKAARLCLANGIASVQEMDRLRPYHKAAGSEPENLRAPSLPFISIPTTLSAGEYTSAAGVTDERGPVKQVFIYPGLAPDIVILDPKMTRATPPGLFFSSGFRAVDHAVETWCSINPTPLSDAYSLQAARLLITSLLRVFDEPDDMPARLRCLEGAWLSMLGPADGVKAGASHGMGHALGGTAGMSHGETSCVMLPHVLRYNRDLNGDRQAAIAAAIGRPGTPLADIIADLVAHLGLPARLRDAGVSHAVLGKVAEAALHDPMLATNPRPIRSLDIVEDLLRKAW
jgi:maleylacetate reductase